MDLREALGRDRLRAASAIAVAACLAALTGWPAVAEETATPAPKPAPKITQIEPTAAWRGQVVRLSFDKGVDWPASTGTLKLYLDQVPVQIRTIPSEAAPFLTFDVPDCLSDPFLPLGTYGILATIGNPPIAVEIASAASRLEIVPKNGGNTAQITGVAPGTAYPEGPGNHRTYELRIQGDGFSEHGCDNQILLGPVSPEICWKADCSSFPEAIRATLDQGRIELKNVRLNGEIPETVAVRAGKGTAWSTAKIHLSQVPRGFTLRVAVALILLGAVIVLAFAINRLGRQSIGNESFGLTRLFIDAETRTYSLSRLQFLVWTAVAVLAYLHQSICTWFVQNRIVFLDAPKGLLSLVMISAATSLTAQVTQSAKGPKGAGEIAPRFSDLITTGGVIAPERFQFLIWTVVGVLVYGFVTFLADPGTLEDLPAVPDRFLLLMGVSSAGYLGGKMARNPGPVINQITATVARNHLVFKLAGRCLSNEATFEFGPDGTGTSRRIPLPAIEGEAPKGIEPEETGMEPTLFKSLDLEIKNPWAGSMLGKTRSGELTILNPDGQKAVAAFTVT